MKALVFVLIVVEVIGMFAFCAILVYLIRHVVNDPGLLGSWIHRFFLVIAS
jgi:hypothetical protein